MDADEIKKLQEDRLRYLEKAYHASNGDPSAYIGWEEIGKELGFVQGYTLSLAEWLRNEGFIKFTAIGVISITNRGIRIIEDAITNPETPSGPFISYNSIHIEQMIGSNIQQGTTNSTQNIIIQQNDVEMINKLVSRLEEVLENLNLSAVQKQDIIADIGTIKAQISSSKPKKQIVVDSLSSISGILQSLPTVQILATEIIPHITQVLNALGIH